MAEPLTSDVLGELLGLLAHDLRNPLSALHSNVGYLGSLSDSYDEDAKEAIADALLSCDGLRTVIDSVEILSHVLTGTTGFDRAGFGLGALIQEAASGTRPLAKSHEVELETSESCSTTNARVVAHRDMSYRALTGLIRNSIQHAPPGSIVQVSLEEDPQACRVLVSDDGTPLNQQIIETAFTAVGQITSKSLRGGRYSRGLGLYCAKVCAELAGTDASFRADAPTNTFVFSAPRDR
ncbi:MAG TPA: HAMP domain-containing sensor histidine kinase [Polyangiaceae bacterium]